MNTVSIAKFVMKKFQSFPVFNKDKVGELQEIFNHKAFRNSTLKEQQEMMLKSSQSKYDNEFIFPFDKYFGFELLPTLSNMNILDLGCFTGGRSAAWFERYKLLKISGIDINKEYIDAAIQFSKIKTINSEYKQAYGENIPFENNQFDAILSFDVFEHVQDLKKTLDECYRVLKPQGKLIVVFPGYFQPIEHHLGLVTNLPGLQYFFSGKTLVRAYFEIIEDRGIDADWYKRSTPNLEKWERGNTINGTTLRQFRKLIKYHNWKVLFLVRKPIGSVGRRIENNKWIKILSTLLVPLTYLPFIQEIVLHRFTIILEKPNNL
jgi:ubiquinone/menaquinone biosynthesis C-methylase UbiE